MAKTKNDSADMITRRAPQWAWDIVDETLDMDSQSIAFDKSLRRDIAKAIDAIETVTTEDDKE